MAIKAFKKLPTANREVDQLQNNIEQYAQPITASQIIDGVLLKSVTLSSATTTVVDHKLGRKLLGWTIVRKRADSRVWDSQDSNKAQDRTLWLECSADVVVDIWVF